MQASSIGGCNPHEIWLIWLAGIGEMKLNRKYSCEASILDLGTAEA